MTSTLHDPCVSLLHFCHSASCGVRLKRAVYATFTPHVLHERMRASGVVATAVVSLTFVALGTRAAIAKQAGIARQRIGKPLGEQAIAADRTWRKRHEGEPIEMLVLGDSLAAGLGATRPKETLGGRLAKLVGKREQRPVRLRTAAIVGAESSDLAGQLDRLESGYRADVAVIIVGGNDVTHRIPVSESVEHLCTAIGRLQARGAAVIVVTCPDLAALRAVPQPLRSIASRLSRRLAAAQASTAEESGAAAVDLRRALGQLFLDEPGEMFSLDRFHPSALGYQRLAAVLAPVVTAELASSAPRSRRRFAAAVR